MDVREDLWQAVRPLGKRTPVRRITCLKSLVDKGMGLICLGKHSSRQAVQPPSQIPNKVGSGRFEKEFTAPITPWTFDKSKVRMDVAATSSNAAHHILFDVLVAPLVPTFAWRASKQFQARSW